MRRKRPYSYVVRDTGISVAFWLVTAVGVVLVGDAVLRGNVWQLVLTASIVGLVVWALGLVMFHPHIRYNDDRVVVTNIGRIHEIPWGRVAAVRQSLTLTIELDDGRRIRAIGVAAPRDRGLIMGTLTRGKLGAGSLEFHKYADALRAIHDEATTSDAPVESRWDVRALAIGAVLALAVATEIIVGVLVR